VIQGSDGNTVSNQAIGATISGGGESAFPNRVTMDYGTVAGGLDNRAGDRATVGGGSHNNANGFRATIGGGEDNISNYYYTTVSGGNFNTASGRHATVGGGSGNTASFTLATISGGANNTASGLEAAIGGGARNLASGAYATVSGGLGNAASDLDATISGGAGNFATAENSTISGGLANRVTDKYGTVGGGESNVAGNANDDPKDAWYSTIGGGLENTARGSFSAIPGGASNDAAGDYSFAAGRRAKIAAAHPGTFLLADSSDADFKSSAPNEFAVRATGGVRLVTAVDGSGEPRAGVRLAQGSGSWESLSDRNAKANFAPADGHDILTRLMTIPISTWNYKTQNASIRHIGPTAQDFAAAGLGADDKYISMVDADGVALAAIQGLYAIVQEKDARLTAQQAQIAALQDRVTEQQSRLTALESRLAALEQKDNQAAIFSSVPPAWLLLVGAFLAGLALGRTRPDRFSKTCQVYSTGEEHD
jgi:hypothetical protein